MEDLHANIKKGRDPDIDRILKEFPNEKHFYNDEMESAAAVALKQKRIKIYGLLISKGMCLGPHEDTNEITSKFDPRMKQIIREINMKNTIEVADHISILISKSKISHNACEGEVSEMEQCIRQTFIDLDQITRIQPILKVVAYAGKPSINFDFYDHKISNMDPMKPKYVRGCCYTTGRYEGDLFIGAKGLMRTGKEYLVALGTLAHELSHYAMQLLYQNHCKPYKCSQDNEKAFGEPAEKLRKTEESTVAQDAQQTSDEDRFSDICRECEENCKAADSEPCINVVFQRNHEGVHVYLEPERHAELIVRIPQLLVLHKNDEDKLNQIESKYSELFNFFEEKILANIELVLSRLKKIYQLDQAYRSKHQNIEHYIERKFILLDANFEKVSEDPLTEDQLIDDTENLKILLLSDEPGAGKTTNLIAITEKLRKKYTDHWIVVIDLKEFADFYKRDGDESTAFGTIAEIENYYCDKIFKFKNLEARNFAKFFEDNRVMFLMDGFDEISPSYKEFNLKLIKAITRESNNRIWISTRPHLEKELQGKLNCSVFRLKPFTIDDRKKYLELKWKSEVMDENLLNEKIQKVEKILNELIEKSKGLDPTSNPLILAMISEIIDDLSNQTNLQMNLYSIYETFVNKKKKIFFEKGPEAKEQMIDPHRWLNINVFHHEVALVTIWLNEQPIRDWNRDFWPTLSGRTTLPSSEDVARLGLMVYAENSNEISKNFHFIHRTFAEYFFADFFIESFSKFNIQEDYGTHLISKGQRLEEMLGLQYTVSKGVYAEKLFNFILEKDVFDSNSNLTMVRHFIYSFWKTRSQVDTSRNEKLQNFQKALNSPARFFANVFNTALRDGSDCWLKDVPEALEVKLRSVEFWKPWGVERNSVMMLSAKHSSSFFLEFLEFIDKFLDPPIWREMFFDVNDLEHNILWYCSLETFKLILSDSPMIPLTRSEKEKLLLAKEEDGFNVLLSFVLRKSKEKFKKYYEVVMDFDEEMPEKMLQGFSSNEYQSFLHYFLSHKEYSVSSLETVRDFFELGTIKEMFEINDGFHTFLMILSSSMENVERVEIFWNFFEDIFEDEAEKISIMRQEDAEGFSALDFAFFKTWDASSVTYIKEKYKIVYSDEDMRQRIMRNISIFSETHKDSFLRSRYWSLDNLMENVVSVFSKDFVRSLFLSCDEKPTFVKDERTMSVLKPLLIEKKIFSEDEMDNFH